MRRKLSIIANDRQDTWATEKHVPFSRSGPQADKASAPDRDRRPVVVVAVALSYCGPRRAQLDDRNRNRNGALDRAVDPNTPPALAIIRSRPPEPRA